MRRTRHCSRTAIWGVLLALMCPVAPGFAAEPDGIRLEGIGQNTHGRVVYLQWGESSADLDQKVGDFPMHCTNTIPEHACTAHPEEWQPDFGEARSGPRYETYLVFLKGHGFYAYLIQMNSDRFDYVLAALRTALGEPDDVKTSEVQDAMGATFDQALVKWRTANCTVTLKKRRDNDLSKGILVVRYLPILSKVPDEESNTP